MAQFKRISKAFYEEQKKKASEKCKKLAKEARKDLSKEYEKLTEKFYNEYSDYPEVYVRHIDKGYPETGMSKTYKSYYKNKNNQTFLGGIIISEENMYDDYKTSKKWQPQVKSLVLYSFVNGYHGLPGEQYPGTKISKIHPIEDMEKIKKNLIKKKYSKQKKMDIKK